MGYSEFYRTLLGVDSNEIIHRTDMQLPVGTFPAVMHAAKREPVVEQDFNGGCLLIGCGSTIRNDDRLGPYVVERVSEDLHARARRCRAMSLPQLDISLVEELTQTGLAIFVDARDDDSEELVRCERVNPGPDTPVSSHTTHSVGIHQLLLMTIQLYGAAPACYAVMPKGYDFSIGDTLSPGAIQSAEQARIQILNILCVSTP